MSANRASRDASFAAAGALVFLCLSGAGALCHEFWRDELQAWLLARDSSSLRELFRNLRYESHPAIWHLLLYPLTRVTKNPAAMQLVHLGLAAIAVWLFLRFSPFTRPQKVIFCLGYFPVYEYSVISRNYAAGMLLLFAVCAAAGSRRPAPQVGLLVAVLANTSVYGLIMAIALVPALWAGALLARAGGGRWPAREPATAAGVILAGVGMALSVAQITPPADSGFSSGWEGHSALSRIAIPLASLQAGYLPLPLICDSFWNTQLLLDNSWPLRFVAASLLAVALIALAVVSLRDSPAALWFYLSATAGLLLFAALFYVPRLRHGGHFYLALIAAFWLAGFGGSPPHQLVGQPAGRRDPQRLRSCLLAVLLTVQAVAGLAALSLDWRLPFSAAPAAAAWLRMQELARFTLVGSPDFAASPLAAWLGRPIFYPERGEFGTFLRWDRHRRLLNRPELVAQLRARLRADDRPVLLVGKPDALRSEPGLRVTELARFTESVVPDERYSIYRVEAATGRRGP
jgi:hypothetical protein